MTVFKSIRRTQLSGIKQGHLATSSGIAPQRLSHIETGVRQPMWSEVKQLREFYKANIQGWQDSMLFEPVDATPTPESEQ